MFGPSVACTRRFLLLEGPRRALIGRTNPQAAAFESVLGSVGELVGEMDHQGSTGMSHEVQKK